MDDEKLTAETSSEEEQVGSAETDEVEETETQEEVETDFDDTEETDDSEDDDSADETEEEQDEEQEKKPQSKPKGQKDAKQAEFRRERQKRESYLKGIKDALGGVNPYTNEEIEDDADVEDFLLMREIDNKGGDPVNDFFKTKREKRKAEVEKAQAEQKTADRKAWFAEDRQKFVDKYPDVDISKLAKNNRFVIFSEGKVGVQPLSKIYEDFLNLDSTYRQSAEQKVKREVAKVKSSPGSLTGASASPPQSYADMSDDDFEKVIARAKAGKLKKS